MLCKNHKSPSQQEALKTTSRTCFRVTYVAQYIFLDLTYTCSCTRGIATRNPRTIRSLSRCTTVCKTDSALDFCTLEVNGQLSNARIRIFHRARIAFRIIWWFYIFYFWEVLHLKHVGNERFVSILPVDGFRLKINRIAMWLCFFASWFSLYWSSETILLRPVLLLPLGIWH